MDVTLDKWLGKKITRLCADGHPLVVRKNRETGEYFLGCSQYPKCSWTDEISTSLVMRLEGHPELPGMEGR